MRFQRYVGIVGAALLVPMLCEPAVAASTGNPRKTSEPGPGQIVASPASPKAVDASAAPSWRVAELDSELPSALRIKIPVRDRFAPTRSAALKWEIGYLALSAIDAAQTIHCLNRGVCEEANPIFGKNPKTSTLIAAKVGGSLLHFTAFSILNKRHPKTALRMAQISAGLQGGVVLLNSRFTF